MGLSASEDSDFILLADDHEGPATYILLNAGRAAALPPPPVRIIMIDPLATPPMPPIREDLHRRAIRKLSRQRAPEIGLVPCNDDQGTDGFRPRLPSEGLCVARPRLTEWAGWSDRESVHLHLASVDGVDSFSCLQDRLRFPSGLLCRTTDACAGITKA